MVLPLTRRSPSPSSRVTHSLPSLPDRHPYVTTPSVPRVYFSLKVNVSPSTRLLFKEPSFSYFVTSCAPLCPSRDSGKVTLFSSDSKKVQTCPTVHGGWDRDPSRCTRRRSPHNRFPTVTREPFECVTPKRTRGETAVPLFHSPTGRPTPSQHRIHTGQGSVSTPHGRCPPSGRVRALSGLDVCVFGLSTVTDVGAPSPTTRPVTTPL